LLAYRVVSIGIVLSSSVPERVLTEYVTYCRICCAQGGDGGCYISCALSVVDVPEWSVYGFSMTAKF